MVNSKEYMKAYNQTYKGIRSHRITDWKRSGIIIYDYKHYYDTIYILATHCDKCHIEFATESFTSTSKNLDHDHKITDRPNVRNIVCKACNSSSNRKELYINNTLGYANIHITRCNTYKVQILIRGNKTNKNFKTLNDAIKFRDEIKNNI